MSWILMVVLYTGEINTISYKTEALCEAALIDATDFGQRKHINIAECILEE